MQEFGKVRHFRELIVWQRSMQLSVAVYDLTRCFPREELYGLSSQMRRAAVSVLSNIAEGHGRSTRVQLAHFVSIARGSNYELEAQILLTYELAYGDEERRQRCQSLCSEVGRMLHSMMKKLETPAPEAATLPAGFASLEPKT